MTAANQKRDVICDIFSVTAFMVVLILVFSVVISGCSYNKAELIDDYSTEQLIDTSKDSDGACNLAPNSVEILDMIDIGNNKEIQAVENAPDESQHFVSWQFNMYEEPDFTSPVLDNSPPCDVQIIEKREDGWALIWLNGISTWVYLDKNLYYIDRWVNLYTDIEDEKAFKDMCPQVVEIIDLKDNWLSVNTAFGVGWVDPGSIRQIVRLDVPSYNQTELGYPLGCELVSLAMMMNYEHKVDIRDLYNDLPRADHPDEGFRGDPASSTRGWTIFPPALSDIMEKYIGRSNDMSGLEMDDLKKQLNTNKPILVWIRGLGWPVHALCLSGYNKDGFYYNDPWTGEKDVFISYDDFYEIWNEPIIDRVLGLTYTPRKALSY